MSSQRVRSGVWVATRCGVRVFASPRTVLGEPVRFLVQLGFDCGAPGVFGGEWILCYVRGPEDLVVELAERLDGAGMNGQTYQSRSRNLAVVRTVQIGLRAATYR